MKLVTITLGTLLLAGSLGGFALAADDGILLKEEMSPGYCHMKFPAIEPSTLGSKTPKLQSPDTGDIIDFYGSCDTTPLSMNEVAAQKRDRYADRNNDHSDDK